LTCSQLEATRTAALPYCNSDPARRNPTDCPLFYSVLTNGQLRTCEWDRSTAKCAANGGVTCIEDRLASPPPTAMEGPLLCSTLAVTRTNTRDLNPPQWCSNPLRDSKPAECAKFYSTRSDGSYTTCEHAKGKCSMQTGTTCE
jgi:hypothetical protein